MAGPAIIAARREDALTKVLAVIEEHDPEAAAQLKARTATGAPPTAAQASDEELITYLCEATAALAGIVGRPRKRVKRRGTNG